ncbi:LPD7 domain-containing protein [Burkholderia sp. PAMC 26561]|uniref:LPD7 domain-containing protein n=1 Tax=Burkholderia sp. PAMC 26561 TaxID=1795043 RepID=UPI000782864E|nr:LPD7 domain-containing protein [Burkholderia sp. PAMC 26561]
MTKADAEQTLRGQIQLEREGLKAKYGQRHGATFGEFLQARAQAGDTRALVELRRMRPRSRKHLNLKRIGSQPLAKSTRAGSQASTGEDAEDPSGSGYDNQIIYRAPYLSYEVHRDGAVTYRHDGRSVVRDHGLAVRVLQTDRAAVEAALRLAHAKFGPALKLQGPVEMQREAAKVAAEAGLYVEFSDNSLNDIMQARRVELIGDRAAAVETRTQDRSRVRDIPVASQPVAPDRAPGPIQDPDPVPDGDLRPPSPFAPSL